MPSSDTPLQLRMRILQLRMQYLSDTARSREDEEVLLHELERAVNRLKESEAERARIADPVPAGAERRSDARANAAFSVSVRILRQDGRAFSDVSIARDVARHGISLVAAFEARPGEKVALDLSLPAGPRLSAVAAEVRWCTPVWTHPGHYLIGLRFTALSAEQRGSLEGFIR